MTYLKQIILFKKPMWNFAESLVFLVTSALANTLGDQGTIWTVFFLSFVLPVLLMRHREKKEEECMMKTRASVVQELELSDRGNTIVTSLKKAFDRFDQKIPKFSEW